MRDASQNLSPMHVLYVDDDILMHELLRGMLNRHQVTSAYSMEHVKRVLEYLTPDIIFCDLMMPLDNGIAVMRYLRSQEQFSKTPIIVLTAADESLIELALSFNPLAVLHKPFERNKLIQAVEQARNNATTPS